MNGGEGRVVCGVKVRFVCFWLGMGCLGVFVTKVLQFVTNFFQCFFSIVEDAWRFVVSIWSVYWSIWGGVLEYM